MAAEKYSDFQDVLIKSNYITTITGAGVSVGSTVPVVSKTTFRNFSYYDIANKDTFEKDPSLVWQFYQYRKDTIRSKNPNSAHIALANLERYKEKQGKKMIIITSNHDKLHHRAGSMNVHELHGNIFSAMCTKCGTVSEYNDLPFCPALEGKGSPEDIDCVIPEEDLPKCSNDGTMLRPNVVWRGEEIKYVSPELEDEVLRSTDLCLVVGSSLEIYPIGEVPLLMAEAGIPVALFNTEKTINSEKFSFFFEGPCSVTLPKALEGIL